MMKDLSKYLVHSSAFHKLMTQPQSKADKEAGKMSKTTQTYLREIHRELKTGRRKEFESKYTDKGKLMENHGITLVCLVKKVVYKKNVVRFANEFITGEPDLLDNYHNPKHGIDIKCSWSVWTFPYPDDELSDAYYWQNQCYMMLTGATSWSTVFCLVNAPAHLITNEKSQYGIKWNAQIKAMKITGHIWTNV